MARLGLGPEDGRGASAGAKIAVYPVKIEGGDVMIEI